MQFYQSQSRTGFSLVEVLIVLGISVMIFGALFGSVQYTLKIISNSSAKLSALSLVNDRMEYFRSLPYDDVGTISGIPAGTIPQNSTTTLNGIEFNERVLVEYVDDAADGALTATTTDSNGIPADYKRLKIEVSWTINGQSDQIYLISNIVPRSIETTAGGGTVRVNVIDADSTFLSGAEVRLLNDTVSPTVDVTRYSDASGVALFSGAPAGSNYQVFVTAPGYSTDQTYEATTTNPNPITSPFAVLESDISTVTFQIGELSDVELRTLSSITEASTEELFADVSGIASTTDTTTVSANNLVLADTAGVYQTTGKAFIEQVDPVSLERWEKVVVIGDTPVGTSYVTQIYTGTTSNYTLVNNSDLPGNATGFTDTIIDLSSLDVATYPDLTVAITLNTSNTSVTPSIDEVSMYYRTAETIRGNVNIAVNGNKTIGTELDASLIYKTAFSTTTNGSGERTVSNMEFDSYSITNTDGYAVARTCDQLPLSHEAGEVSSVEMVLVGAVTNSLRVTVINGFGGYVPGAEVTLSRTGFSDTQTTDSCGQVFFNSGIVAEVDYDISVSRNGYGTESLNPFDLSGESNTVIILTES